MRVVDYDHLYELEDPFSNRFFRGSVHSPAPGDFDPGSLLTGEWRPTAPITVRRAEGRIPADIIWTGYVAVVLISERLAAAFEAAHFTGWSTYPVEIDAQEVTHQGHLGLTITGRCGPLDRTRGEWIRKDDEPGRFLRGLFFDERSWDGSDFFLPVGTLHIFLTERVRDCLTRQGVKNVRCERLSDVTTSELVIRSTGRRAD